MPQPSSPLARRSRNGATPAPSSSVAQFCVGVVAERDDTGGLQVRSGSAILQARRAASCLLEPAPGDSVACLQCDPGEAWVTAVLHRDEGAVHVLRAAEGAAGLRIEGGPLAMHGTRIDLHADRFEGRFASAAITVDRAEIVGRCVSVMAGQLKAVGQLLSTVMERVQHFSRGYVRTTEGIDRVAATHVEVEAEALLRMDAEHALVNGRSLVKARGAQIHFG